jgi:hypothetical protein
MKSYLIDEISGQEIIKIRDFLKKNAISSGVDGLFWIKFPDDILTQTQFEHVECKPHVFAIELGHDWIKFEFFVRSLKKMKCLCPDFCTNQQRNHVIKFADNMINSLGINT